MNLVIINNLPKFSDAARWDFELVCYEADIDHTEHQLSYFINERGRSGVTAPANTYQLYVLATLSDADLYRPHLTAITSKLGQIDRLIVFAEGLQDVAAQLRDEFGIPGNGVETNRLGRNKLLMKQKVAAAQLRAPRYQAASADQSAAALLFAEQNGYPLILKPVDGQSSAGVLKIENQQHLQTAIAAIPPGVSHDLEEFIDGVLFHVDGLIDAAGQVVFVVPSRYINPCFDFSLGAPLGAIMLDPTTALYHDVCRFSVSCLQAIGLKACPFHLELFQKSDGELVFLEVGARVGGADVPYVIHRTCGVNLFSEWIKMILGQTPPTIPAPSLLGAWLMFPRPATLPVRVKSVTDFTGQLDSLDRQLVPTPGELLQHEEGYCSMQSGRFLFCAESVAQVSQDVETVLRDFCLDTASL